MKNLIIGIVSTAAILLSCTPQNPNPNGNGSQSYTYTQGTPITDIDGNTYPTIITSCGQTWTAKNLNVSKYRNGDIIPQVTDPTQWMNLRTGAWCYYNNDPANGPISGKLYNWYAVNDPRGLAPSGWRVPSETDWNKLTKCIDPNADTTRVREILLGLDMKSITGWHNGGNGTNSSGFNGFPGGFRLPNAIFSEFSDQYLFLWSANELDNVFAWIRGLYYNNNTLYWYELIKENGHSVRCIKN